jgi:hypothetical protein
VVYMRGGGATEPAGVVVAVEDVFAGAAWASPPLRRVDLHDRLGVAPATVGSVALAVVFGAAGLAGRDDGEAACGLAHAGEWAHV